MVGGGAAVARVDDRAGALGKMGERWATIADGLVVGAEDRATVETDLSAAPTTVQSGRAIPGSARVV